MLVVSYEGKLLLICTSYVRTSSLCRNLVILFHPFFAFSNLREPTYRFLSSFSSFARFRVRECFPLHTIISGFVRTDIFFGSFRADRKNGDSGCREARVRKKWKKKWSEDREKGAVGPRRRTCWWSNYLFFHVQERIVLTEVARERSG